ncbi:50S ribosomal protein L10 [Clostridiaceae bacterium NSJ-31]|uniref:Large ribosomal subunit protein uL10 n=1 Tax=Ligaoa zhengdingensis TaxID=2763658 RepID=A0A926I446_9FIRM|nr:50S ribosomal protein L10 [Ligaoa zhengdingensis]MBC8546168.1 50S ribosomal protein L10 [Ligaoa zhengdingensis]
MPSEKVLQSKKEIVAELRSKLDSAAAGVLVDYKGITVADDTKLRKELREAGVEYKVVKNTLLRFAAQDTSFSEICSVLDGTTALAISTDDVVAPAKILGKFAEDSKGKFQIKAGFMDGKYMDVNEVMALSKLPGKEQLLCMLLSALNGNIRGLAVALNAIAEKAGEPAAAEPAAEEPTNEPS